MAIDDRYAEEDFTTEEMFIPELPELPELPEPPEFVSRGEDSVLFGPEAEIDVEIPEPPDILDLYGDEDDRSPVQAQSQPENTTPAQEAPAKEDKGEPKIEEPADNDESKGKKVKGVEKTGDHESLWSKIKNGFKKVKEFVQNLSEALRTHDISMFKAWVYGGKRLVNTLVETDITNNAIKQKEAQEIQANLSAQIKELEAQLAEMRAQQPVQLDGLEASTEQTEEKKATAPSTTVEHEGEHETDNPEVTSAQQAKAYQAKAYIPTEMQKRLEVLKDLVSQMEEEKGKGENADAERIASLADNIVVQYQFVNEDVLFVGRDIDITQLSTDEATELVEDIKAMARESTDIVFEALKVELETEELEAAEKAGEEMEFSDDTPSLRQKLVAIDKESTSIVEQLSAEMGAKKQEDPTLDVKTRDDEPDIG